MCTLIILIQLIKQHQTDRLSVLPYHSAVRTWNTGSYLENKEGRKEMFYLTTHSTHFIYGYMVKDHSDSEKGNPLLPIGYSFRLTARFFLYAPAHRQDSTYHGLCYTNRGALVGTRNSSVGSPHEGSIRRPITPWANALTTELHLAPYLENKHREYAY